MSPIVDRATAEKITKLATNTANTAVSSSVPFD